MFPTKIQTIDTKQKYEYKIYPISLRLLIESNFGEHPITQTQKLYNISSQYLSKQ